MRPAGFAVALPHVMEHLRAAAVDQDDGIRVAHLARREILHEHLAGDNFAVGHFLLFGAYPEMPVSASFMAVSPACAAFARATFFSTLAAIQSSTGCSTSRLFFSIIMKCALPLMPISASLMWSRVTPAWRRNATVPGS